MSGPMKKLKSMALAIGLAMAGAGTAQAVTLSNALVGGVNDLIDESRETYVDANSNGLFDIGDVIFGYIRISDVQPKAAGGNNQIYGVFSQEIVAGHADSLIGGTAGRNVFFGPTTVAGLTLADLLGLDPNVGASAIAAFYDKPTPYIDLINMNPPGPPADMPGYFDYIRNNGTLRLVAGFTDSDDFLYSEISIGAAGGGIAIGASNAPFVTALSSFTLASNFGAFSVQYKDALPFIFQDIVPVAGPLNHLVLAEVGISSGATGGADGPSVLPAPKNWLNAGGAFNQCSVPDGAGGFVDTDCGFTDKNNFTVNVIPEPGSLALVSAALLAAGGLARRRWKLPV